MVPKDTDSKLYPEVEEGELLDPHDEKEIELNKSITSDNQKVFSDQVLEQPQSQVSQSEET
jgi:hypothetical protein